MINIKKDNQIIGHNLRRIRKQRGLMQIDLAVSTDVDRTYISRVETGQARVSFNLLCKLVKGLEITSADLLEHVAIAYAVREVKHNRGGDNNGSKISQMG